MKVFKYLFIIIFLFALLYLISPSRNDALCNTYNNYLSIQFNGIVVKKFIDSNEHSFPFIYVKDINGTLTKLELFDDDQNTYEHLNLNDSIVKFKGNAWIYKKNNGTLIKVNYINFGCHL